MVTAGLALAQEGPSALGPLPTPPIERDAIDAVIRKASPWVRYCYQRELVKDPLLAGDVVMRFTIGRDGRVTASSVKSTTLADPAVGECLADRFAKLVFPAPADGGQVIVSYPFVFTPSEGAPLPAKALAPARACLAPVLGADLSGWSGRPAGANAIVAVNAEHRRGVEARLVLPALHDDEVDRCLLAALGSMRLPKGWSYGQIPAAASP